MAETDSPLKRLLHTSIKDFAAWLLDTEVLEAHTVNVELPGGDLIRTDQLFRVFFSADRSALLHIEFQGRSSHKPMKWRMLEYMARLAEMDRTVDLASIVFYVGHGAGALDSGDYAVKAPDGTDSLRWQYRVIHLWKMSAEELLALDRPGLLPLLGQTRITQAATLLPAVIARLKAVEDRELQSRLVTSLVALIADEGVLTMIEKLVENAELLLDTPYLRRIREQGREQGREEGLEQGLEQGTRRGRQQAILDIVTLRLNPSVTTYRAIEKAVTSIDNDTLLEELLAAAVQVATLDEFKTKVDASSKD